MTDDFVTRLQLQLRDVALHDERRGRVGTRARACPAQAAGPWRRSPS